MTRSFIPATMAVLLAAGACSMQSGGPAGTAAAAPSASAEIRDASGQLVGTATATQSGTAVRIHVEATAMPAGEHGAHIHATGACDAPAFQTAGGHWNPTMRQHGKDNPAGMHMGDLPNLSVGSDGRGTVDYTVAGASISGGAEALLDGDGAAIVIHAQADDYKTDPSGNSGGRIACGVFH